MSASSGRLEIRAAGGRVVVDHHRQVGRVSDRGEELEQLDAIGAVQQRRQRHHAVGARGLRVARVDGRLLGGRCRDAGAHRHSPGARGDHRLDDLAALVAAEAAALADGPVGHDAVDAAVDQPVHLGGDGVVVDVELGVEVGDDRCVNAVHCVSSGCHRSGCRFWRAQRSARDRTPPAAGRACRRAAGPASSSPVAGASVIPSVACAVATCRPGRPGTAPMKGRPSGDSDRIPAQSWGSGGIRQPGSARCAPAVIAASRRGDRASPRAPSSSVPDTRTPPSNALIATFGALEVDRAPRPARIGS